MLKLNLLGLEQCEQRLREEVPGDHALWEGLEPRLLEPLRVDLTAQYAGDGILVRGTLESAVEMECRRCLTVVRAPLEQEVGLWFQTASSVEPDDDESYPLPERGVELDLSEVVREQVVLAVPAFALCSEACRGLCPRCGANRNEAPCGCAPEAEPSPWDALKKITLD
ncbi:MAG: DUF177 domain-containing protein [Gemmatimonadota bacterium]|nr:DUF177 domain-containing protein [Gemmatimonadota bacterium]